MKINWKQKLTSRKFWAAIITFVTAILVAVGVPNLTIEQVTAVITAASVMVAYIIGEGLVDAKRMETNEGNNVTETQINVKAPALAGFTIDSRPDEGEGENTDD